MKISGTLLRPSIGCICALLALNACQTAPLSTQGMEELATGKSPRLLTQNPLLPETPEPKPRAFRFLGVRPYSPSPMPDELEIIHQTSLSPEQIGYILYDPETKNALRELNANQVFIPASVTKIVSTVAALKILGPDYRFSTEVSYHGMIKNHVLKGDLYLRGSGDPLLTVADLQALAEKLRKTGIKKVSGKFFFDETFLSNQTSIDLEQDFSSGFNPGLSALSSEFNQTSLFWRPSLSTKSPFMNTFLLPLQPQIELGLSQQITSKSFTFQPLIPLEKNTPTPVEGTVNAANERWVLSPHVFKEGIQRIPVKNPGLFTANLFKFLVELGGVKLPEPQAKKAPPKTTPIASRKSLPLIELSEKILEFSNNLMTELVHLSAARKLREKPVALPEASQLILKWYQTHLRHVSWRNFALENGSGLGSYNRVSPWQLTSILNYASRLKLKTPSDDRSYLSLLPISGMKGTLAHRMADPTAALRVWAKTGSQNFCNSLAGYVYTRSGKKLIFAILTTDFTQRALSDTQGDQMSGSLFKKAQTWAAESRNLQDRLLTRWIEKF